MKMCGGSRLITYQSLQRKLRAEQDAMAKHCRLKASAERFAAFPTSDSLIELIQGSLGDEAASDYARHLACTASSPSWLNVLAHSEPISLNCRLEICPAIQAKEGGTPKPPTLDIEAYNGGPMNISGYREPVVVDILGVDGLGNAIPILRDHDTRRTVGHGTAFAQNHTLRMKGQLSFDNADANEIAKSSKNGFPWQASIGLLPIRIQPVLEGEVVFVNGKNRVGPFILVREGKLKEVSIVALGADDSTKTRVAAASAIPRHKRELGRKSKI